MRLARLITLLGTLSMSSFAGLVYDFTYTPQSGVFDTFHFQIGSDSYLTTSPSVPFTPFTITAGADQFTISRLDVYELPWATCYTFGSQNGGVGQCGGSAGNPGNAFIGAGFYTPLTSPGTYVASDVIVQAQKLDWSMLEGSGTLTLNLSEGSLPAGSETPEPASMALMGAGLVGVGVLARGRCTAKQ